MFSQIFQIPPNIPNVLKYPNCFKISQISEISSNIQNTGLFSPSILKKYFTNTGSIQYLDSRKYRILWEYLALFTVTKGQTNEHTWLVESKTNAYQSDLRMGTPEEL